MVHVSETWIEPHRIERELLNEIRKAKQERDKERVKQCVKALVHQYVYYGEYYKLSSEKDPYLAQKLLKKALQYQNDHPIAHYRLAHLLFEQKQYAEALYHFQKAIEGNPNEGLNQTQTIIAHLYTCHCALSIAKEAKSEAQFLMDNAYADYDREFVEKYLARVNIDEGLSEPNIYTKKTPEGIKFITEEQFFAYEEHLQPNEVLLRVTHRGYEVIYQGQRLTLNPPSFYVLACIIGSDGYISVGDIYDKLVNSSVELHINTVSIRQHIHRLSRRMPFWDDIIETHSTGNRAERRRREGITYALLCHSSVVLPK
ncbi:hypothetical protein GCM10010965_21500 [Caldalkalibacillus thermarum]|uniref:tetratricopeptide repeat protein n=1 Tax=Caldalkalibacillus thermarum TaxID=296745 RepID=UPI0016670836|nr:tetratricopeptide repeat protein [Caldalkalibacillus thermarum]GGK28331.1 hypothetical protein GCM10010965_21500 [Caldalkalibacillus thermarum]